jgi:hypothetical protein
VLDVQQASGAAAENDHVEGQGQYRGNIDKRRCRPDTQLRCNEPLEKRGQCYKYVDRAIAGQRDALSVGRAVKGLCL